MSDILEYFNNIVERKMKPLVTVEAVKVFDYPDWI